MRVFTSDRIERWSRRVGFVALAGLAWAALAPEGDLWAALLAAGVTGSAFLIAVLAAQRRAPLLAPAIASTGSQRGVPPARGDDTRGGLHPRGEQEK